MRSLARVNRFKFVPFFIVLLVYALTTACDSGSQSVNAEDIGRVITQTYVSKAKVCIDRNMNFRCESSEKSVMTDENGTFRISSLGVSEEDLRKYQIIAVLGGDSEFVGYGRKTGNNVLASVPGFPGFITPLTTIISVESGRKGVKSVQDAKDKFKEAFGLPNYTYFISDYVVEQNAALNVIASYISSHQKENLSHLYNDLNVDSLRTDLEILNDDIHENAHIIQSLSASPENNTRQGKGQVNLNPKVLSNLPFTQGMDFGVGYDKLTGNILSASQCIESNLAPYQDGSGRLPASFYEDKMNIGRMVVQRTAERNEVDYYFKVVESKQDLYDMFKLDASIDLQIGEFSGHLEGQYIKEVEKDQSSVYVLIKVDAKLADFKIINPVLTDPAVEYFLCDSLNIKGCVNNSVSEGYNPENFRKKCGDYFLNVITTGGSYYAMMKIKTNSLQEKKEIGGKLNASYKSETGTDLNVKGGFTYAIDHMVENYNASIHIITKGVPGSLSAVKTKDDLMKDIDAFFKNLSDNAGYAQVSLDDDKEVEKDTTPFVPTVDYRKAVFEVKFEDYEQTFMENIRGGASEETLNALKTVSLDKEIRDTIIELYSRYEYVESLIRFMLAFPESFVGVIERDGELMDILKKLRAYKAITKFYAYECTKTVGRSCKLITQSACESNLDPDTECDNSAIIPELYKGSVLWFSDDCDIDNPKICLEKPETIVNTLPFERLVYPKTCVQRKKLYATNNKAGIYTLFMGGNKDNPYLIYCDDMDKSDEDCHGKGDDDSEESPTQVDYDINCGPKEYLILNNISPQPSAAADSSLYTPSYNFSRHVGYSGENGEGNETMLTSVYYKLRVLVNQNHLAVVPDQEYFVSTLGDAPEGIQGATARYGTTSSCSLNKEWSANAGGIGGQYLTRITANIDLEGTPFVIPEELVFITNKQFDVVKNPASHDDARVAAAAKKGYLPVILDDEDNAKYKDVIDSLGISGSWLGLKTEGTVTGFKGYKWLDVDYLYDEAFARNKFGYNDSMNVTPETTPLCGFMSKAASLDLVRTSDPMVEVTKSLALGQWAELPCSGEITVGTAVHSYKYPYIIEYLNLSTEIEVLPGSGDEFGKQKINLRISNKLDNGKCGHLRPAYDLKLEYSRELAEHLGIIEKLEEE